MDEIEERETAIGIFLGDGNDQPEIGFYHFCFCAERFSEPQLQGLILLHIFLGREPGGTIDIFFFNGSGISAATVGAVMRIGFERADRCEMLIRQMDKLFGYLLFKIETRIQALQGSDGTLECS